MIRKLIVSTAALAFAATAAHAAQVSYYQLPPGSYPHDVAAAPDGSVWFSGQQQGFAGRFDPASGKLEKISLGAGAAPHGVIIGSDGAAWLTEGGNDAIARVDLKTKEVKLFPLPKEFHNANLNTPTMDKSGIVWFTGQNGVHGRVDPKTGKVEAWRSPRRGTYGITVTPGNEVWYAALAGDHLGHINRNTGEVEIVGFQGHAVGKLLERRRRRPLRSRYQAMDALPDAAEQVRHLLRLCRRQGPGVGDRLGGQRHPALRPRHRDLRHLPERQARGQHPSDARPARRGVGRRVRDRPLGGGARLISSASGAPAIFQLAGSLSRKHLEPLPAASDKSTR
jgi:sugar lactone lactonase YvrE